MGHAERASTIARVVTDERAAVKKLVEIGISEEEVPLPSTHTPDPRHISPQHSNVKMMFFRNPPVQPPIPTPTSNLSCATQGRTLRSWRRILGEKRGEIRSSRASRASLLHTCMMSMRANKMRPRERRK